MGRVVNNVSPKVKASSLAALISALVVTYVLTKFPVLVGHSDVLTVVVDGVVTSAASLTAGYYKRAVGWATKYVQDHEASKAPFVRGDLS